MSLFGIITENKNSNPPNITVNKASVEGDATLLGDLDLTGDLTIIGDLILSGGATLTGDIVLDGKLEVQKTSQFDDVSVFQKQIQNSLASNQIQLGNVKFSTLNAPDPASNRKITLPDGGKDSNLLLSEGAQLINGANTFSNQVAITSAGNQLQLGVAKFNTINCSDPIANRVVTIPDAGSSSNFLLSAGDQSASGVQSFTNVTDSSSVSTGGLVLSGGLGVAKNAFVGTALNIPANSNQLLFGSGAQVTTVNIPAPVASQTVTLPDAGASSNLLLSVANQSMSGIQTLTNTTDSSSKTTGALVVSGGAGVSKNLFVGTALNIPANSNQLLFGSGAQVTTVNIPAPVASQTVTLPDAGASSNLLLSVGNQSMSGVQTLSNTTNSTSNGTGALVVSGGIGVTKDIWCSGKISNMTNLIGVSGGMTVQGGIAASNNLVLTSTSNATKGFVNISETTNSTSTATGCLVLGGGMGINGDTFSSGVFNSLISKGFVLTGTTAVSGAGATLTFTSKEGQVQFTGNNCAKQSTLTLTITNTLAGNSGTVSFLTSMAATVSAVPYMQSVTWNSGASIVVVIGNASATTDTGSVNWTIMFRSFN